MKIKVPATSANLGPGFDVFGLAINICNEFAVENADRFSIEIHGGEDLSEGEDNLFYTAFTYLFAVRKQTPPVVHIDMKVNAPQGRGFGSSATAVVGGLMAANSYLGNPYTKDQLLPFAIELERDKHPDNVAPALLGGLVVITRENGSVVYEKMKFPEELSMIYFVPDFPMDTVASRKLMPKEYSRADVVFNLGRVGLFLAAICSKDYTKLRVCMQDKIHQPTRTTLFPAMPYIIQAAVDAGAYGSCLSGGGSAILALAEGNLDTIKMAMEKEAKIHTVNGYSLVANVCDTGAIVEV